MAAKPQARPPVAPPAKPPQKVVKAPVSAPLLDETAPEPEPEVDVGSPGLYNKYRPRTFDEVVGQAPAVRILQAYLAKHAHNRERAILISGPSGCGKTTLARILTNQLGCGEDDFTEMNAARSRGIDDIRAIQRTVNLAPMHGECRVWLIDEVHQLTKDAQTALLKTLEDTPRAAYFILATTDPRKLIETVKTRCLEVSVKSVNTADMKALVADVVAQERGTVADDVVDKIVDVAAGCCRRALVLLSQVMDIEGEAGQMEAIQRADCQTVAFDIARALLNPSTTWGNMAALLKGLEDEDPEGIRRMVMAYCQTILLSGKASNRAFEVMCEFKIPFYDAGNKPLLTLACYAVVGLTRK